MKRANNLFSRIVEGDNLRLALSKALRGNRNSADAREFAREADCRLARMGDEISRGTFRIGRYHQFVIYDPKERTITAPCFAERVLHHAIMNVCEPVLERPCATGSARVPLALPVLDWGKAVCSVALAEPVAHNRHVSNLTRLPPNTIWC